MLTLLAALATAHATTFVIDTTDDTADAVPGDGVCADGQGRCSLRAAMDELYFEPELRIELPDGDFPIAYHLNSTIPGVTTQLEIVGVGPGRTRILPAPGAAFLHVPEGTVTLRDLALEHGDTDQGVLVLGGPTPVHVTLHRVAARHNVSEGRAGVVWVDGEARLTLRDVRMEDNTALEGGGAVWVAGGPARPARLEVFDSTFARNAAPFGAAIGAATWGGAPYDWGRSLHLVRTRFLAQTGGSAVEAGHALVAIEDCVFADNTTPGSGAALYTRHSGVDVSGTAFLRNVAGGWEGGAVTVQHEDGQPEQEFSSFRDVLFVDNDGGTGGGLQVITGEGTSELRRAGFVGNTARTGGGGLAHLGWQGGIDVSDSWFVGNRAGEDGGGMLADEGMFVGSIHQTLFLDNEAGRHGGGLYVDAVGWMPESLPLSHLTLVGNHADADADGVGAGGGLSLGGTLRIRACVSEGNTTGASQLPDDCDVFHPSTGTTTGGGNRFAATSTCDPLWFIPWLPAPAVLPHDAMGKPSAPLAPGLGPVRWLGARPYLEPLPGGPLVDAGGPATRTPSDLMDLLGRSRVVDGDGDGRPAPDIGAVELQAP